MEQFGVDITGIVKEGADNTLDLFDTSIIKQRAVVCIFGKLGVGSINNWCSFV